MAFLQFMGGAAKRGLQKIEDNEAIIDKSINLFTQLGIPAYKARKELKKQNKQMAETLRDNGFGIDAIGTILSQGKGQKVVDYLDKMSAIGRKANVADVVKFLPEYKESGLTMDEMLESVVGKVNRGMSMSDAVMDATGQKSETTFGKFFSGTNRKLVEKRLSTYKSAFGEGMLNDLRALAVGDVSPSYFPEESRGTISLFDPAAAALLAGRESSSKKDDVGSTFDSTDKFLRKRLGLIIGHDEQQGFDPDGIPIFSGTKTRMQQDGNKIVDTVMADYEKKKKYTGEDRQFLVTRLENLFRNQYPQQGAVSTKPRPKQQKNVNTPLSPVQKIATSSMSSAQKVDEYLKIVRGSKPNFNFDPNIPNRIFDALRPGFTGTKKQLDDKVRELLLQNMK